MLILKYIIDECLEFLNDMYRVETIVEFHVKRLMCSFKKHVNEKYSVSGEMLRFLRGDDDEEVET